MAESKSKTASSIDPNALVAETESGARNPTGVIPKKILFYVPLVWTLFQLWYASPLPFLFNIFVLNDTEALGVAGMRERAALVGGELRVFSRPGAGARVEFRVPLEGYLR